MAKKRRDRRSFSDEFKQQLIDEINGGKKLIDVAEEHGLQPSQLSLWKKKLGGSGKARKTTRSKSAGRAKAATQAPSRATKSAASSPASSSTSVAELERVIGQLTIENMRLRRQLESN